MKKRHRAYKERELGETNSHLAKEFVILMRKNFDNNEIYTRRINDGGSVKVCTRCKAALHEYLIGMFDGFRMAFGDFG